jgi:hypothetical protein
VLKAHVVAGRYGLVCLLGLLSFALNSVLNAALLRSFGVPGLAASTTATNVVVVGIATWKLWPDIRGTLPTPAVRVVLLGAALSGALATALPAPPSLASPALWWAALPFLALLGLFARRVRQGP